MSAIDTGSNTVITTITVGKEPDGLAVDPAAHMVYVTNAGDDSVSVIDTATNMVVGEPIKVGKGPRLGRRGPDQPSRLRHQRRQ